MLTEESSDDEILPPALDGAIASLNGAPAGVVGVLCGQGQMFGSYWALASECEQPENSDLLLFSRADWAPKKPR